MRSTDVARMLWSGTANTSASRAMRLQFTPGGAKPGECRIKPASISPRANASSCTSPVASISSSCTLGCCSRKRRTQRGSRSNPTVDTNASLKRPASPSALARANTGSAAARASRSRTSGSNAAPAGVSCTLRLVRSKSLMSSATSSCAMACVSGGCVMFSLCAALLKCNSSATARNWRHRRSSIGRCLPALLKPSLVICMAY